MSGGSQQQGGKPSVSLRPRAAVTPATHYFAQSFIGIKSSLTKYCVLVSLDSLSAQQLTAVKKQLDEEVEHLTTSFAQLQAAQIKFKDCLRCVKAQGSTPGE